MNKVFINKALMVQLVEGDVRPALAEIGAKIVSDVRESMVPGTGRTYKHKGRVHTASAAGRPPSPDSGKLRDSITFHTNFGDQSRVGPMANSGDAIKKPKRAMGGYVVSVGSNVHYALAMEKGTKAGKSSRRVADRPYLWPALVRSRGIIKEAFNQKYLYFNKRGI